MGSRRIGVLALLMLAGCLVASSERPALDFASEAPRLRNADLRQPSRVIRHALVGDGRIEQQHRQVFQEAGSPPRGVPAQQSPSRHMQHGRHLQQVVSWHSNVPYSAATSAETQQGTASPAVGQPMFLSWSRWRGPSAAVQTESGATGAVAPASTVRLGPGVSRRARQRWSQASQLQPPLQQLTPMLQQQQPQPEVMPDQEQPMAYAVPSATEQAATAAVAVNVEPAAVAREQADNQPEQAAPVDTMQPILSAAEVEQPDISAGTEGSLAADQGTQPLTTKQAKRKRRNAQLAASMAVDTAVAIAGEPHFERACTGLKHRRFQQLLMYHCSCSAVHQNCQQLVVLEGCLLSHLAYLPLLHSVHFVAGLMHSQPADMPALQPADLATAAAEAASPPTVVPVHLAHPGLIAEVPSGLTPNKPSELPAPSPSPTAPQQAKFCIPATRGMQFNVLAAGDSITQGSVPSKMINHPYTIQLSQLLQRRLGKNADATDAGTARFSSQAGC